MWGQLWRELCAFVATLQDPTCGPCSTPFWRTPKSRTPNRNAPAAKTLHHAYIGGLLDHVVSLMRSCDLVCRNYPQVNRDLVIAGAFFHDIGKIHELTYARRLRTARGASCSAT